MSSQKIKQISKSTFTLKFHDTYLYQHSAKLLTPTNLFHSDRYNQYNGGESENTDKALWACAAGFVIAGRTRTIIYKNTANTFTTHDQHTQIERSAAQTVRPTTDIKTV